MTDLRGLYGKFSISRTDGRDAPGEKHHGCAYFVLDITHDPAAIPALRAYAEACKGHRPILSADLNLMLDRMESDGDDHTEIR